MIFIWPLLSIQNWQCCQVWRFQNILRHQKGVLMFLSCLAGVALSCLALYFKQKQWSALLALPFLKGYVQKRQLFLRLTKPYKFFATESRANFKTLQWKVYFGTWVFQAYHRALQWHSQLCWGRVECFFSLDFFFNCWLQNHYLISVKWSFKKSGCVSQRNWPLMNTWE